VRPGFVNRIACMKTHSDKTTKLRLRFAFPCFIFLAVLFGNAILASGQGQLGFANTSQTLISTNGVHGGPALGATAAYSSGDPQFVYALFVAPSSVTSVSGVTDPNWTFTGAYGINTAFPGRLSGGLVTLPPPYATGSTFNFMVRGWSSNIAGQDWASVQAFMHNFEVDPNAYGSAGQFFGTSGIATMVPAPPDYPTLILFGTTPGSTLQGFLLDQVRIPEPSVFALAAFGSVALMVARRATLNSLRSTSARSSPMKCLNICH
jgi:hypothetical protein